MTFFRPTDVSRIEPVAQGEENLDAQINTQQADFHLLDASQGEANYSWGSVFRAWPVEDPSGPIGWEKHQGRGDRKPGEDADVEEPGIQQVKGEQGEKGVFAASFPDQ